MRNLFDALGNPLALGAQLGAGGEGAVFAITGDDRYVAKIYHQAVSFEKAQKLRAMVDLAVPELTAFASWPMGTLHEGRKGPIVGTLLPRVNGYVSLQNLYSPAHRRVKYPDKDWSFLLHVAVNCAAAFDSIHQNSHVIGDVNQGNLLVSAQGKVFLIDCDSFQVCFHDHLFPCEVGVGHFTAPELQGHSFRGIRRTTNHDNFGLAVLLFHLLFLGRHPYAGCYAGAGEMPIERAIQEFRFAFGRHAGVLGMNPPWGMLPIEQIAPSLAALFERAFNRGSERPAARPPAKQWYDALRTLQTRIRRCPADEGHCYVDALEVCPWCELSKQHGLNFFASVTVYRLVANALDDTLDHAQWHQIEAIPPPPIDFPHSLPGPSARRAVPLARRLENTRLLRNKVRWVAFASLMLTVVTVPLPRALYFTVPSCLVFVVFWVVLTRLSSFAKEARRRRQRLQAERSAMNALKNEWTAMAAHYSTTFHLLKMPLAAAYDEIKGLKRAYDDEYVKLERDKVNRQRARYLQCTFLSEAHIDRIDERMVSLLASQGVETADDIDAPQLQRIWYLDHDVVKTLLAWRQAVEAKFRYNAAQGLPEADLHALIRKFIRKRAELQQILAAGVTELQEFVQTARDFLNDVERRYQQKRTVTAHAEADVWVTR